MQKTLIACTQFNLNNLSAVYIYIYRRYRTFWSNFLQELPRQTSKERAQIYHIYYYHYY